MIQRQKGGFVIQCDACGDADETYDVRSFSDAWSLFKKLEWRAVNAGDAWTHQCPGCARARLLERGARRVFGGAR